MPNEQQTKRWTVEEVEVVEKDEGFDDWEDAEDKEEMDSDTKLMVAFGAGLIIAAWWYSRSSPPTPLEIRAKALRETYEGGR